MPAELIESPNALPADPLVFVDRDEAKLQVATIVDQADAGEHAALVAVTGYQGSGKTTLAVHLAHSYGGRFPDGALYVALGGSTPVGVDTAEALAQLLMQLGYGEQELPATAAARAALFRRRTVGRRFLVVLDDAQSLRQVEEMLPPRRALRDHHEPAADGGAPGRLREGGWPLTEEWSMRLLRRLVDAEQLDAEPEAARALVTLCGGLPLALRIVAAEIRMRRPRPIAALAAALREATTLRHFKLLDTLLDHCSAALDAPLLDAYRRLGLHPGPTMTAAMAAAMFDAELERAGGLLDGLVDVSLLEMVDGDRYRFHPLVAVHAREQAGQHYPRAERDRVVRVAVTGYLELAVGLAKAYSRRPWTGPAFDRIPAAAGVDQAGAAAAFVPELANLRAAVHAADQAGLHVECAQLCQALLPWCYDTNRATTLVELLPVGAAAAESIGDLALARAMRHALGQAHEQLGEPVAALRMFHAAHGLAVRLGDALSQASAVEWQALVHEQFGRPARALQRMVKARSILEAARVDGMRVDPVDAERALALLDLHTGRLLTMLRHDTADTADTDAADLRHLLAADAYFTAHQARERINVARTKEALARASRNRRQPDQARALLEAAVDGFAAAGASALELRAVRALGEVVTDLGDQCAAERCHERARVLTERLGQPEERR
jgi:tetratricopeptide (TPR) repeat protein